MVRVLPSAFAILQKLCVCHTAFNICFKAHWSATFIVAGYAGRAGVPMEVMGLMLGEFVDEYTVKVVDVFAMPQSGTGVSVEAVDPVFQTKMLDMLKQCGRCDSAALPLLWQSCLPKANYSRCWRRCFSQQC